MTYAIRLFVSAFLSMVGISSGTAACAVSPGGCQVNTETDPNTLLQMRTSVYSDQTVLQKDDGDEEEGKEHGEEENIEVMIDQHADTSKNQAATWSSEEAKIVKAKLERVMENPPSAMYDMLKKMGWNDDSYECYTGYMELKGEKPQKCTLGNKKLVQQPTASKFLRLGFHDCIPYPNGKGGVQGGCDGCLHFANQFRFYKDDRVKGYPDPVKGDNNGLAMTADVLEQIYTDPNFPPKKAPALRQSLKASGKSRADLWAFAALVATDFAMKRNNEACISGRAIYAHVNEVTKLPFPCKITPRRRLKFYTGRPDCPASDKPKVQSNGRVKTMQYELPDGHRYRPYETTRDEEGPNPSGNSAVMTEWFRKVFGFDYKQTTAIMGAHSLGRMQVRNSIFRYQWQHNQIDLLNNNYYRIMMKKPSKVLTGSKENPPAPGSIGGPGGALAETGFFLRRTGRSKSGGPELWHNYHNRCPSCEKKGGKWKNVESNARLVQVPSESQKLFGSDECCKCNDQNAGSVSPHCGPFPMSFDQVMLNSDMAIGYNFQSDPNTGEPSGCPTRGSSNTKEFLCPPNTLKDGSSSMTMYERVAHYADNQNDWVNDFYDAMEKMLSNGNSGKLVQGPDVLGDGLDIQDNAGPPAAAPTPAPRPAPTPAPKPAPTPAPSPAPTPAPGRGGKGRKGGNGKR